jgi:hypothetical protein
MLAKVQGVICLVLASLSTIAAAVGLCGFLVNYFFIGSGEFYFTLLVAGISGVISSFILALPTWIVYAYGQITKDLRELKGDVPADEVKTDDLPYGGVAKEVYNPDDLPEI